VTVAFGLQEIRALFKKPTFREAVATWLQSFPRWEVERRIFAGTGHMKTGGVTASGHGMARPPPNASIEQRVAALEANVQSVSNLVHATRNEFESEITAQKKALDEERRERNREDAGIRELIDQAVAGGLTLEAMGLVWLVVGLLLSTTSTEMAKLLP